MTRFRFLLFGGVVVIAAAAGLGSGPARVGTAGGQDNPNLIKQIVVPANAGWVDTGIDAAQGEEFHVTAQGEITLQKGNPDARCGPAGLDIMTVQQPILNHNLGALVGKVAQLVGVRKDENTGEEIRDEIVESFFIGAENDVKAPIKGRLYLGVNENVVRDNGGEFQVQIFRKTS